MQRARGPSLGHEPQRDETASHRQPSTGDAVTFPQTSEESGGIRTLGELEVAPGGKVTPHYHLSYTETFSVYEGRLTV